MKKLILLLSLCWTFSFTNAQYDLYYTPSKQSNTTVFSNSSMSDYEKYRAQRDGVSTPDTQDQQLVVVNKEDPTNTYINNNYYDYNNSGYIGLNYYPYYHYTYWSFLPLLWCNPWYLGLGFGYGGWNHGYYGNHYGIVNARYRGGYNAGYHESTATPYRGNTTTNRSANYHPTYNTYTNNSYRSTYNNSYRSSGGSRSIGGGFHGGSGGHGGHR